MGSRHPLKQLSRSSSRANVGGRMGVAEIAAKRLRDHQRSVTGPHSGQEETQSCADV